MAGGYYIQIGAGNTGNETVRNRLIEAGKMAGVRQLILLCVQLLRAISNQGHLLL